MAKFWVLLLGGTTTLIVLTSVNANSCVDTFMKTEFRRYNGGTDMPVNFNSVQACKAYCLNEPTCTGFDFNRILYRCAWHALSIYNGGCYVDHYRRHPCNDTGGGCVDIFVKTDHRNFPGGTPLDPSINSVEACKSFCLAESTCNGFDFNTVLNRCTWHADSIYNDYCYVDHYRKQACEEDEDPCVNKFVKMETRYYPGGTLLAASVNTVQACKDYCIQNSQCMGFDFNHKLNRCTWHAESIYNHLCNVDHYRRQPCQENTAVTTSLLAEDCVATFQKTENRIYLEGTPLASSFDTLKSCQDECLQLPSCQGIDFNHAIKQCYLHAEPSINKYYCNVDNYKRQPCDDSQGACTDTFEKREFKLYGGTMQPLSINTVQECQASCLAEPECRGFDFNRVSKECKLVNRMYQMSCNWLQFERQPCDQSSGPCNTFSRTESTRTVFGSILKSVNTTEACKDHCAAAQGCNSFAFLPEFKQCWWYTDPRHTDSCFVDHYRKQTCDDTDTTDTELLKLSESTTSDGAHHEQHLGESTVSVSEVHIYGSGSNRVYVLRWALVFTFCQLQLFTGLV